MKAQIKDRLKLALEIRGMKQVDLIKKTNIEKGQLSSWLSGKYRPNQKNISLLAKTLLVSEAWLMGYNVPIENSSSSTFFEQPHTKTKKIPLLGSIACGLPILAIENTSEYIDISVDIQADFALRCKGDSMIDAHLFDGDIVFIRNQSIVENGEISAVLINNTDSETETTLKRVYIEEHKIKLCSANQLYKDIVFSENDMNRVTILGKVVANLHFIK